MEGKCLWINTDDVDGPIDEGHVVVATRPLNDWCLRGDDGSEPVATGTALEIVETRPWGAAMARVERDELHYVDHAVREAVRREPSTYTVHMRDHVFATCEGIGSEYDAAFEAVQLRKKFGPRRRITIARDGQWVASVPTHLEPGATARLFGELRRAARQQETE